MGQTSSLSLFQHDFSVFARVALSWAFYQVPCLSGLNPLQGIWLVLLSSVRSDPEGYTLRHGVNISISFISLLVSTITLGPLPGAFVFCHQVSDLSGAKAALPRLFPAA